MFVSTIAAHCPNLHYLSMINNEAAPIGVLCCVTLWCFSFSGMFVSTIAAHCPNLHYLSMMNNEAAPSFFNGGSYQQYMDFR